MPLITCKEYLPTLSHLTLDLVTATIYLTSILMLAGSVFFILQYMKQQSLPTLLSAILLGTSFFMLQRQATEFSRAYEDRDNVQFQQGFRYLNWLIDLPLIVLIWVMYRHEKTWKTSPVILWCALSAVMVLLGYFARFVELNDQLSDRVFYILMNVLSVLVMVYLFMKLYPGKDDARLKWAFRVLIFSWTLYVPAYFADAQHRLQNKNTSCPVRFLPSEIAAQQVLFSFADILSKLVYTLVLFFATS